MKIFAAFMTVALIIPQYSLAQSQPSGAPPVEISGLTPIPLHPGINVIPDFMPNGRSATIILAWRDNGDAGGSDLAMIMDQEAAGGSWEVVSIDPLGNDAGEPNVLYDDPHTGEDDVSTFRFARGKVNGVPATLLLTATRALGASIPSPSLVSFKTLQLVHEGAITVGVTHDYFSPIATSTSKTMYCNADKALSDHFGLPLRISYGGPPTSDGCPQMTAPTSPAMPTTSNGPPQAQMPGQAQKVLDLAGSMRAILKEISGGDEDQALGDLYDLKDRFPNFAPIYFWMAVIYDDDYYKVHDKGFLDAARYYITQCYLLDPNFVMEGPGLGAAYALKIERQEAAL